MPTTDFFDSPYFSINKKLLRCLSLWPYQSRLVKILIRTIFVFLSIIICTPQILTLYVYSGVDINKTIRGLATSLYVIVTCLKMFLYIATEDKIKQLYEYISQYWKAMDNNKEDMKVILKQSQIGRIFTIGYVAYMSSALVAFITMPMLPLLIDVIIPLNESRPLIFILDGEYLVDSYEHYKKIYAFESLTCIVTVFILFTTDSTYAVCVQQCIGLMEVVKMRLDVTNKMIKNNENFENHKKETAHSSIVQTIQFHQKAIDFANVLESTYAINFLVVTCFNVAILSVGSAVILMNFNRPMEVLRFTMIYIGLMLHLLYLSWPGQKLIDVSEGLLNDTYNNKWYEFPIKTQKIVHFMRMRCKDPCQLTAGGIYVLNIANCGAILRTSLSYITVFASMV